MWYSIGNAPRDLFSPNGTYSGLCLIWYSSARVMRPAVYHMIAQTWHDPETLAALDAPTNYNALPAHSSGQSWLLEVQVSDPAEYVSRFLKDNPFRLESYSNGTYLALPTEQSRCPIWVTKKE